MRYIADLMGPVVGTAGAVCLSYGVNFLAGQKPSLENPLGSMLVLGGVVCVFFAFLTCRNKFSSQ